MSGRALLLASALAVTLATLTAGASHAANWLELNFYLSGPRYEGVLPPCDNEEALSKISSRFNQKEYAFWSSNLTIVSIDGVRQTAYRPGPPHTIPRRYCSGVALVSDGVPRPVHYAIGEDTGMIGASWGVEWCLEGFDRNWAFNPRCKMARP